MRLIIALAVLFCDVFIGSVWSVPCGHTELTYCAEQLNQLRNLNYMFAETEEDLKTLCFEQKAALTCLNNYAKKCLTEEELEHFSLFKRGAMELITDLCSSGTALRKQYLTHSTCLRKVTEDLKRCSKEYRNTQEIIDENIHDNNELLLLTCCTFDTYRNCTGKVTEAKCGPGAGNLVKKLISKLGGSLLQDSCSSQLPYCNKEISESPNRSTRQHSNFYQIGILTFLLALWTFKCSTGYKLYT